MMLTHICPFCGTPHEREENPEPLDKPCPECWLNREDAIALMSKEDWSYILEIIERADRPDFYKEGLDMDKLPVVYERLARQVYQKADETIATILKEKK